MSDSADYTILFHCHIYTLRYVWFIHFDCRATTYSSIYAV